MIAFVKDFVHIIADIFKDVIADIFEDVIAYIFEVLFEDIRTQSTPNG